MKPRQIGNDKKQRTHHTLEGFDSAPVFAGNNHQDGIKFESNNGMLKTNIERLESNEPDEQQKNMLLQNRHNKHGDSLGSQAEAHQVTPCFT